PIDNGWEDNANHFEAQQVLTALNQLAFGRRGAPGLTVRSVIEDGADVNAPDNLAAFQATLDTVANAGGGIAFVPPGIFQCGGPLTIPLNVILRGVGDRSAIRGNPGEEGEPVIRFAPGTHRGGMESLQILGNDVSPNGIGIDLTGAQHLRVRNFQVWDFHVGVVLSDGITLYAGQNQVSDFEINRCHIGLRAWQHSNQNSVLNGRIWRCRHDGNGIGIDIQSADALAIAHVVVEHFDLGIRLRGRAHVSLRDIYYEADNPLEPQFPIGLWMDIRPEKFSTVLMENSLTNPSRSLILGGSLEDAITNDERSSLSFGAKRHHAAAPERNLLENGDFRRTDGATIAGWAPNIKPVLAENINDFVTAGRSFDITQNSDPNDGIVTSFTVPETTDYITLMVRFKNISSAEPLFRVGSGAKAGLFQDLAGPSDEWRVEAITTEVDPAAGGVVQVILTADQSGKGGQIRVDEVWAVVGATAAPPRAHGHRFEILPEPLMLVKRSALKESMEFGETDLTQLQGFARPPRGVIGAILSLRGTATPAGRPGSEGDLLDPSGIGATLPRAVRPFIRETPTGQRWTLDIIYDRLEHDRQVILRGTSFVDGINVFNSMMSTNYRVELVGWVLPS
ncbi:MAG TPA: hypothetical protein VFR31_13885, partial [Thermoanaerobaculia bacterium]|nr:hypothetical protein [Thermoanaerobaculia bacterium]